MLDFLAVSYYNKDVGKKGGELCHKKSEGVRYQKTRKTCALMCVLRKKKYSCLISIVTKKAYHVHRDCGTVSKPLIKNKKETARLLANYYAVSPSRQMPKGNCNVNSITCATLPFKRFRQNNEKSADIYRQMKLEQTTLCRQISY